MQSRLSTKVRFSIAKLVFLAASFVGEDRFMRLLVLALTALFPTIALAQSAVLNECPNADDLRKMELTAGTGQNALENAERFYSSLYGKPQTKMRAADKVTLTWVLPNWHGQSKTLTRTITVSINPQPTTSCNVEY
jgi:hypothetical protein